MNRMQEIMKIKKITQKQLEEITGIKQSELSKIMNGKPVYLSTAQRIAKALGKTVDYIWPNQ